jgi:hypothetical protein
VEQEADRRHEQGRPVMNAWAPALEDSVAGLHDIRVECDKDDPERVWRLETLLKNERARVARLETLLENERATASEEKRCNEMLLTEKGATIGKQEGEIERLQEEIERLREESLVARENERLQEENERLENERLRAELLAAKAADKVTKLVEGLEVALRCPLSLQSMKDTVVSRYGHSYEREDIETWLKKKSKCPITNQGLTRAHLVKNYALVSVADAFRDYQAGQAQ